MQKKLFGLTGQAGSGKDTVAEILSVEYGVLPTSFAAPLKQAALLLFGMSEEHINNRELKETLLPFWDMSPREILQKLGTDAMRNTFGDNFWLRKWFTTYTSFKDTDDVSVTDVRFPNEAELIRSLGGTIVHIVRPGNPLALTGAAADHPSNKPLNPEASDVILWNDSDLNVLRDRVGELVRGNFKVPA